jgi:plastocyanin/uncharacterized membrane protein
MPRFIPSLLSAFLLLSSSASANPSAGVMSDLSGRAVQLRCFFPLAHAGADTGSDATGGTSEGASAKNGWSHFVRWIGHFHPAMTMFPIAMLLGAALAEFLLMIRGKAWLAGASRWCVIVGAVGAVITAPLGWAFAIGQGSDRVLEIHRWLGTAAGAGAVVILFLSEMTHRTNRPGWRAGFRTVLFVAVPLVIATGFLGGAMVYGLHEYDWNPRQHGSEAQSDHDHSQPPGTRPTGTGLVRVTMADDDMFKPASLTIAMGTTVRWINTSKDAHTVTDDPHVASSAKDVAMPTGAQPFNSGKIQPGGTFEHKFTVPGRYKYVCEPHEEMDMKGEIEVKPSP